MNNLLTGGDNWYPAITGRKAVHGKLFKDVKSKNTQLDYIRSVTLTV